MTAFDLDAIEAPLAAGAEWRIVRHDWHPSVSEADGIACLEHIDTLRRLYEGDDEYCDVWGDICYQPDAGDLVRGIRSLNMTIAEMRGAAG